MTEIWKGVRNVDWRQVYVKIVDGMVMAGTCLIGLLIALALLAVLSAAFQGSMLGLICVISAIATVVLMQIYERIKEQ